MVRVTFTYSDGVTIFGRSQNGEDAFTLACECERLAERSPEDRIEYASGPDNDTSSIPFGIRR